MIILRSVLAPEEVLNGWSIRIVTREPAE